MLVRDDEIATCDAKFALTGSCERQKVNLLILLFGHLSVPDYHQRMSFDTQRVLFAKRRTFLSLIAHSVLLLDSDPDLIWPNLQSCDLSKFGFWSMCVCTYPVRF